MVPVDPQRNHGIDDDQHSFFGECLAPTPRRAPPAFIVAERNATVALTGMKTW
jgi:hypothetical protein